MPRALARRTGKSARLAIPAAPVAEEPVNDTAGSLAAHAAADDAIDFPPIPFVILPPPGGQAEAAPGAHPEDDVQESSDSSDVQESSDESQDAPGEGSDGSSDDSAADSSDEVIDAGPSAQKIASEAAAKAVAAQGKVPVLKKKVPVPKGPKRASVAVQAAVQADADDAAAAEAEDDAAEDPDFPNWVKGASSPASEIRASSKVAVWRDSEWRAALVVDVNGYTVRVTLLKGFINNRLIFCLPELLDMTPEAPDQPQEDWIKIGWALVKLPGSDSGFLLPDKVRVVPVALHSFNIELGYIFDGETARTWIVESQRSAYLLGVSNRKLVELQKSIRNFRSTQTEGIKLPTANDCEDVVKLGCNTRGGFVCTRSNGSGGAIHPKLVELCFTKKFVDAVKTSKPRSLKVPVGSRRVHFPPYRQPLVLYQQGDEPLCLGYSLASALAASGDAQAALTVALAAASFTQAQQVCEFVDAQLEYSVHRSFRKLPTIAHAIQEMQEGPSDLVYLCVLRDNKGAENHALSVWNGRIFDSCEARSLPLSQASLDLCTNPEGCNSYTCAAITRAYSMRRHKKRKHAEI